MSTSYVEIYPIDSEVCTLELPRGIILPDAVPVQMADIRGRATPDLLERRAAGAGHESQPEEMAQMARELGVRIVACQMSMDVMGIHKEELIDGVEVGGVATFLGDATRSKTTLFI